MSAGTDPGVRGLAGVWLQPPELQKVAQRSESLPSGTATPSPAAAAPPESRRATAAAPWDRPSAPSADAYARSGGLISPYETGPPQSSEPGERHRTHVSLCRENA